MDIRTPFADVDEELLLQVLETQVTLDTVRDLLREKGLSCSAQSWADMKDVRIKPALNNGTVLKADLVELIRQSEEHGGKHVRLFQYSTENLTDLAPAFDSGHVRAWAAAKKLPTSAEYVFAVYPDEPTVTEVRVGDGDQADCFVLKVTKTDNRRKQAVLQEWNGGTAYISEVVQYRAVDVVKVHSNGMIEVRLDPRSERPVSYSASALAALSFLKGLLETPMMAEMSLANAKNTLSNMKDGDEATKEFKLNQASLRNASGDKVISSALVEVGDAVVNSVMPEVIGVFTGAGYDPYCEHVRVGYNFQDIKLINTILSDDVNEVIFTASLNREEYENALLAILKLNAGAG